MTINTKRLEAERVRRARPRWFELEPGVLLWPVGPVGSSQFLVVRIRFV
jgi:hypothetical protein